MQPWKEAAGRDFGGSSFLIQLFDIYLRSEPFPSSVWPNPKTCGRFDQRQQSPDNQPTTTSRATSSTAKISSSRSMDSFGTVLSIASGETSHFEEDAQPNRLECASTWRSSGILEDEWQKQARQHKRGSWNLASFLAYDPDRKSWDLLGANGQNFISHWHRTASRSRWVGKLVTIRMQPPVDPQC